MIRTALTLLYESRDISADIAPYLIDVCYTDHAHGQADDLTIRLQDRDRLWQGDWFPAKGARLTASLRLQRGERLSSLACGVFVIDEIEASASPSEISIRAASAAVTTSLRREKRTRAWQSIGLRAIAGQIAGEHNLSLYYQADLCRFDRVDQREESDLAFLQRLCQENGLNLKVKDEKIIIFAGHSIEEAPAAMTISRQGSDVTRWSLKDKAHDVFRAATVIYSDPESKSEKSYTFTPPDAPATGQVLKVNRRVESLDAAMRRARHELRGKNKDECAGEITVAGNPALAAGININLSGWGNFDGKYFVERAAHGYGGGGYTTAIGIRRVLGY